MTRTDSSVVGSNNINPQEIVLPLLNNNHNHGDEDGDYLVNYRGDRVIDNGSKSYGGWRSAGLIIVVEIAETIAYYGISANLINYLTGPLRESTIEAAENVNTWTGFVWMLPLLGAFVADSYLGRFRTIVYTTFLYVLGMGLLTLSVALPSVSNHGCPNYTKNITSFNSPTSFQIIFFFSSLYLVAFGRAGVKPCLQAFGADQFSGRNPEESKSKSSFFNWWYFGVCFGGSISRLGLTYIEDNFSWGLGFGIPSIALAMSLVIFLLGTKTYRYSVKEDKENTLVGIAQVIVKAVKNCRYTSYSTSVGQPEEEVIRVGSHQFKFLDKALINTSNNLSDSSKHARKYSINQVEDAKMVLRIIPIWITCFMYAINFAQSSTFYVKQANTMERSIGKQGFQVPSASLQTISSVTIVLFIPIYDRLFVPFTRIFSGISSGITVLQRMGIGIFLSSLGMVIAALVENRRLQVALDFGLVDKPEVVVPMSVWWLAPQYVFVGLADAFMSVGMQEFFYDQVPDGLRSMGVSVYLSVLGIGSFLSRFLIYYIDKYTSGVGHNSWFSDNLNRAHLDYFYWLLAVLSLVELVVFLYISKCYIYKRRA